MEYGRFQCISCQGNEEEAEYSLPIDEENNEDREGLKICEICLINFAQSFADQARQIIRSGDRHCTSFLDRVIPLGNGIVLLINLDTVDDGRLSQVLDPLQSILEEELQRLQPQQLKLRLPLL